MGEPEKPPKPPKLLIPTISLMKWKPDQQVLDVALGKKPDKEEWPRDGKLKDV